MDAFGQNFISYLNGPLLAWYLFVLVCLVVLTRCRLVTVVLCWVPLILTVCYLIFSNSLTNNSQIKKFFHGVNVGEDISTTRDAPENSLAALELALNKSNFIMFDVRLTNDDVAVVTKDDNKNRVEVKTLNVSETSSAQLHRIHLRKGKGEIPLFNEMMEACQKKDARVVVNIQRSSNTLFKLIADYVRKHDLQNRVIVTSFNPYVPFMMKKKDSQILTGLSFSSTGITTHFARTQRDSIVFKYIGQFLDAIMHVVVDSFVLPTFVGSDVIFLDHKDVSLHFIESAGKRNIRVVAVGVDGKDEQKWINNVAEIPYFTRTIK